MKPIKLFFAILAVLTACLSLPTTASAGSFVPGNWVTFSYKDGVIIAASNITVSKSGQIAGKAMYTDTTPSTIRGQIRGKKVLITERARGESYRISGTINGRGDTLKEVKLPNGVKVIGVSLKGKYKHAGIYYTRVSSGDKFIVLIAPNGAVGGIVTDGASYVGQLSGSTNSNSISVQSSDGYLTMSGSIANRTISCSGTFLTTPFSVSIPYLR